MSRFQDEERGRVYNHIEPKVRGHKVHKGKKGIYYKIFFFPFVSFVSFVVVFLNPLQLAAVSLEDTLKVLDKDTEFRWDPFFRSGFFTAGGHKVSFETGLPGENGDVIVDNKEIFTLPLPYTDQGLLQFPESFVTALKTSLSLPPVEEFSPLRIAAIVIDPGHGGKDSGAVGNHTVNGKDIKLMEKDITLKVSTLLRNRLTAAYPGKQILMTRTGDTYPTLEDRVKFAHAIPLKEDEAIVFISIHTNASFTKSARGYEVWYLSPEYRRDVIGAAAGKDGEDSANIDFIRNTMIEEEFTTESIIMARSIIKGFEEHLGPRIPSRGIKAEEWFVVRNARMPSVLVEMGFITNEEDAALFQSETHLRSFSDALYKGIADFITLFEQTGGFITN